MKHFLAAALAAMTLAVPAFAQSTHNHAAPAANAVSGTLYDGEVKRVSKDTKRVTLAHGPLTGLDMPAMTMAFPVKDAALLDKLKPGDKVRFALEKSGEDMVVTRIEPAR
jgi:Cu(I)/Ag(I) efflux system periplasmic protein CusF